MRRTHRACPTTSPPNATVPLAPTEQHANNRVEADHAQLKRRLRPMRGLKTDVGAKTVIAGHAFIQNIRRGHYELATDALPKLRVAAAVDELAQAV
jgi:transposase, IS6 family